MKVAEVTKDKRRIRGEESRKQILKSAIDNIAIRGLGSLTLDRVAEKLGVSRGLVVFHFKSKNNLIMEVLEYLSRKYSGGWNAIAREEGLTDIEKLLRLVDYDIRFACDNPKYVSAWHAFWGESKGKEMFHDLVLPRDEGYIADMERLIESIVEREGYGEVDVTTATRGLTSMMFGAWLLLHLNPGPNDYEKNMQALRLYLGRIFPGTELAD
ncbi:MAG: TetR/AcrR family transcriptional regulator [Gammaproteobacteria bacterium]|nr:TetR/AcrR family transcriptional regulator [Gammaproteobacteria bacterium]